MTEERHLPLHVAEALRTLKALRRDTLSPAERVELENAARLLELAYPALRELVQRIERCGASPELTHAVTLCSDLASAIGNRWNRSDEFAEQRVRGELAKA